MRKFLLTEEERLHQARIEGKKIVGAMKDLGAVPVMAYASARLTAFYPDGAWWIPCVMELSDGLFKAADSLLRSLRSRNEALVETVQGRRTR